MYTYTHIRLYGRLGLCVHTYIHVLVRVPMSPVLPDSAFSGAPKRIWVSVVALPWLSLIMKQRDAVGPELQHVAVSAVDWPCLCLCLRSVLQHRFSLGHFRFWCLLCLLPPLKMFSHVLLPLLWVKWSAFSMSV